VGAGGFSSFAASDLLISDFLGLAVGSRVGGGLLTSDFSSAELGPSAGTSDVDSSATRACAFSSEAFSVLGASLATSVDGAVSASGFSAGAARSAFETHGPALQRPFL
jgi:hypothetical protein